MGHLRKGKAAREGRRLRAAVRNLVRCVTQCAQAHDNPWACQTKDAQQGAQ